MPLSDSKSSVVIAPVKDADITGARGLLGKNRGALKKHADNKFSWRALMFLAAGLAVPVIWLLMLNDATKPHVRVTPTALSGASALVTPVMTIPAGALVFVTSTPFPAGRGVVTVMPRSAADLVATSTPGAAVIVVTAAPSPTLTPTFTPSPFPGSFWVAVTLIDPDASASNCYPGRYGNNRCNTLTASGVDWRLLYGRGAGCPESLPLGAEVVTESGAVYVCIDRTPKVCRDQVCPIYVFFPAGDDPGSRALFERAYSRSVSQVQ